ncbi:hypothetical protein ZWY2020_001897 [Hordeum vulgare]|nr:hypothetical protein ZWY2020_001897 [Hordeum vulgare]
MAEVRGLSYDVEDSVDEFTLIALCGRRVGPAPAARLQGLQTHCRLATEIHPPSQGPCQGGGRAAREVYRIDDGVCSRTTGVVAVDPRLCSLYNDVSQLVGTDEPMKELIGLLKEGGGAAARQLKVVSVVGFCAMGKTSLANQIYHTFGKQFMYRAFVSVSLNPDATKVLRAWLII